MAKSLVQEQFGATAAHYLTSKPHAKGKSLERLVELVQPKPGWRALDVATGAGHTAYAFAPHVARVWATDITEEMLTLVRAEIDKRKLANVRVAYAKAEALPFEDESFDLVTCRIAPHHFDSIALFLDAARAQIWRDAGDRRQHRPAGLGRRLPQCVRALARPQPSARLDHGAMARGACRPRPCHPARGIGVEVDRVFQLGEPPRRQHAGAAQSHAGRDHARGEGVPTAGGKRGQPHFPFERGIVHRSP